MKKLNNIEGIKKVIGWCYGYGGLEMGIQRCGVDTTTIAISENAPIPLLNIRSKMEAGLIPECPIWEDLKTFPCLGYQGQVDIFTAGFPCQGFSNSGLRAGTGDPRHLFPHVKRGVQVMRPEICFFENVDGILTSKCVGQSDPDGTPVAFHVLREIERCGYHVRWGMFSAAEIGAPHRRQRVFFMGIKGDGKRYQEMALTDWKKEVRNERKDCERRDSENRAQKWGTPTVNSSNVNEYDLETPVGIGKFKRRSGKEPQSDLQLQVLAQEFHSARAGRKLSPRWVESLMGLPRNWVNPTGKVTEWKGFPNEKGKDQFDWEDSRTIAKSYGDVSAHNQAELRLLGNGVVPQTAAKAFATQFGELSGNYR